MPLSNVLTARVPRWPMTAGAHPSSPGCSVRETRLQVCATCTWPWSCRTTLTGPPDPPLSPTPVIHSPTSQLPSDTNLTNKQTAAQTKPKSPNKPVMLS